MKPTGAREGEGRFVARWARRTAWWVLLGALGCVSDPPALPEPETHGGDGSSGTASSTGLPGSSTGLPGTSSDETGPPATCGNGLVDAGEDCDPGTGLDAADCNADCTAVVCGDGHANLAADEDCDDGNGTALDDCTPECRATLLADDMTVPGRWTTEIPVWTDPMTADPFALGSGWVHGLPEPGAWQSGVYSESAGTARLISPPIAIPPDPGEGFEHQLRFLHRYRFDANPVDVGPTACPIPLRSDGAVVWVMDEAGMQLARIGPSPEATTLLDDLGGCGPAFGPTNPLYEQGGPAYTELIDWTDETLSLAGFEGMTIRLVFEIGYDCANCWQASAPMTAGWALDDVVVAPFAL